MARKAIGLEQELLTNVARREAPYIVYGHQDPLDGIFRCVGQTNNLLRRTCEHFSLREPNLEYNAWLCELAMRGYVPQVITLERCDTREEALRSEKKFLGMYSDTLYKGQ